MKFCSRPWEFFYLTDAEHGQVWPCAWLDSSMNMGNILEDDVDKIYNSEIAIKLRKSILDGTYRYCSPKQCMFLANNSLPDMTEEEIQEYINMTEPNNFNVSYDETCNHACISCRRSYFKGREEYYNKVDAISEKMLPYFNRAKRVSVDGRGDIFSSEHLLSMLERLKPKRDDFWLAIETNAALFDEKHWQRIKHFEKYKITVMATVNSFHDSTYRYLNGYANHVDKVIENLHFIRSLREKGSIDLFTISMVAQESNFRELPEYVDRCLNEFGADKVRIRGIMQFGMDDTDFWIKDVFNPAHPFYREAIDILHHPIMQDKRVWYWEGDYEHTREPKELPAKRFEKYYNNLWNLIELHECGRLNKIFERFEGKSVALYGAGKISQYLIRHLPKDTFKCVFDSKKCGDLEGITTKRIDIDSVIEDVDVIINTISFYMNDVNKLLDDIGYCGERTDIEDLIR